MNETKVKAMELAIAASGADCAYDPPALVKMAANIEVYITGMKRLKLDQDGEIAYLVTPDEE
jgi:hypothetical protein